MVRFLLFALSLQSCIAITHDKNKLLNPELLRNQKIPIATNGFYHSELNTNKGIKSIAVLILYDDGFLLNLGVYDGVSNTYCGVKKYYGDNSYAEAKSKLKSYLEYLKSTGKIYSSCKIKNNDIDMKGLFQIKNDSIRLQYYVAETQNENKDSFNSYYLYELKGIIVNYQEFIITEKINYRKNTVEKVNLIYKFEENKDIPNVKNYFKK
jgi:hypothetical protein